MLGRIASAFAFAGVASLLLFAAPAAAGNLEEEDIQRFISSMEAIEAYAAEEPLDLDNEPTEPAEMAEMMAAPLSSQLSQLREHHAFDDVEGIIVEHGFADADAWAETGDQVLRAFMALEMEEQADLETELEQMRRQLDEAEGITEAQRAQMEEIMEEAMMPMVETLKAIPEADIEAVRPHRAAIRQAMQGS